MNAHTRTHQGHKEPQRERGRRNARNRTLLGQNPQHHAAREAGNGGDTTDPTVRVTQPAHTALRQHTQESERRNTTDAPAGGTQQVMHSLHAQGLCVLQHNPSPRPRCTPRGAAAPAVALAAGSRRIGQRRIGRCPCQESVCHTANTHTTPAPGPPASPTQRPPRKSPTESQEENNEHKSCDKTPSLPSQPSTQTNTQQGAPAWTHTQLAWTDRQTPLAAQ
jgi:hypothetical protein